MDDGRLPNRACRIILSLCVCTRYRGTNSTPWRGCATRAAVKHRLLQLEFTRLRPNLAALLPRTNLPTVTPALSPSLLLSPFLSMTSLTSPKGVRRSPRSHMSSAIGEGFQASLAALGGQGTLTKDGRPMEEQVSEFVAAVNKTKDSLHRLNRGLLKPKGTFVQTWDMVTASGLLFTMFVTPFEVGMDLPTSVSHAGPAILFALNQIVTLIFALDIIVNFVLPVPTGQGSYERRHVALAQRYLKSWFFLDMCAQRAPAYPLPRAYG